ncbi:MAG: sigma 54-interacting transcriptional regulator, partial [Marinisporobacter sp.]|nr:sigma 54-interacting transcriptional regulator [Marinisporobacter sp.]
IPETLIESELFGHEGGAFTGAKSCGHKGFFEQANGGTLFLDEVGELPLLMQSKLLKAIQERKIVRVGGTKAIDIDVRLIAATNQDLKSMVSNKQFRPDLFYRLNVVPITIPPLRERKNDIIPLALHFLSTFNDFYDKNLTFSSACLIQLQEHHWPGNIRELKNLIERACVTCESNILTEDMLFESQIVENDIQNNEWKSNLSEILEKTEYNFIREYYDHYKSVRKAAEALGMDRSTFNRKKLAYEKKYKSHI